MRIIAAGTGSRGVLLLEVLVSMAISGILLVTVSRFFPLLSHDILTTYRQHQLDNVMRETLLRMEKDLRRTGYCRGSCRGEALRISAKNGEPKNSCVITAYDLNHNGVWARDTPKTGEFFGYRLTEGALEWSRNADGCQEKGWEKVTDHRDIRVTAFSVTPVQIGGRHGVRVRLALAGRGDFAQQQTGESLIAMPNYQP